MLASLTVSFGSDAAFAWCFFSPPLSQNENTKMPCLQVLLLKTTIFPLNSFECSASKVSRFFMKVLHHIVWQYRSAVPTPPLPTMCPGDKTPIVWPTCWMSRCVRCIRRRNNRGVIPCAAAKKKASDLEKSPELISRTFWGTGTGCWMVLGGFAT